MRTSFLKTLIGLLGTTTLLAAPGCRRQPASVEDCRAVLDRIIELELSEAGYRDPVLRARWHQDLGRRFAPDLERCRGLRMHTDLRDCLKEARTPDEIAHRCLD
jgi:hypothetical protein